MQRIVALTLIAAAAAAFAFLAGHYGQLTGVEALELRTLDYRQRVVAEPPGGDPEGREVVLVLFDSASVGDWPYLSPFPRTVLAELVTALSEAGARTIGLDVYLDRLYPDLNRTYGGDDALHEAIEAAGNVILVAPTVQDPEGPRLAHPHPRFAEVAAGVGAADLPTPFETVREGVLAVRSGPSLEPSFALSLYGHSRGLSVDSLLEDSWRRGRIELPGLPRSVGRIPDGWREGTSGAGEGFALHFPIRFLGPPSRTEVEDGTFPAFSASFVPALAGFSPEFFRDRIVLLGTGFHDEDKFRTPFYDDAPAAGPEGSGDRGIAGWTFGVEVHANALQNLLDGRFVREAGAPAVALLLLGLGLVAGGGVFGLGTIWGGVVALGAALGVFLFSFWLFAGEVFLPVVGTVAPLGEGLLWIPLVAPFLGIVFSYVGSTAWVAIVEGREKRFIRGAFGKYVPEAVVEEIAKRPEVLRLGGQKRPLTILFSDLAGFTTLSEGMEPEDLVALLNEYLTEMTAVVMAEEGTLDKYIGDAIMAFWNAPKSQEDHADRALRCAVRMQRKLTELNRKWSQEGRGANFEIRIGVNTGPVVVGNIGGRERFDYSAVGDAVNLAARLEPANKTYGTDTMVSEHTVASASPGAYRLRELDLMAVKGKEEPVTVFELLEMADAPLPPTREEAVKHFESGLSAFRNRDWTLAAKYFSSALKADPEDGPSRVYLERAETCLEEPPPADWDFVVRRSTK